MHASELAAFGTFAEILSAMALVYAGLPNFRYRSEVQRSVRDLTRDVVETMADDRCAALRNTDCWAILFLLGRLQELGAAPPDAPRNSAKFFMATRPCRAFGLIFLSNLDKAISINLGFVSGSVIWFGALDQIAFPEPTVGDPARELFLTAVAVFYWLTLMLGTLALIAHLALWEWDLRPEDPAHKKLIFSHRAVIAIFIACFALTSLHQGFYLSWVAAHVGLVSEDVCLATIAGILLIAVVAPTLLIIYGNVLTDRMKADARHCYERLKKDIEAQLNVAHK